MKIQDISKYALWAVCAVIVVCFILFFAVGYDEKDDAGHTAPMLTDVIMVLMYVLGVVTAILMIWSLVKGARSSAGNDEKASTGIPGTMITIFTCVITIVSLVVGLVIGLGEPDFTSNSGVFTPGYMITMVDAFLWSIYILCVVSVITVVLASTGVLTKTVSKKK